MDENLHLNQKKDEAEAPHDRKKEDRLLNLLTEATRGLEAVRHSRDHHNGSLGGRRCMEEKTGRGREGEQGGQEEGMLSPAEEEEDEKKEGKADEKREEKKCKQEVLEGLRELSVFQSDRVTAWREVFRECARMLHKSPPGGSDQQHPSSTGV